MLKKMRSRSLVPNIAAQGKELGVLFSKLASQTDETKDMGISF